MNFTSEQMNKARQAKSAEELLTLAKGSGVDLSAKQAGAFFAELHKEGDLSDEELDAVVGGKGDDYISYSNFVNAQTDPGWAPICPNALRFATCNECAGLVQNGNGGYYCNGKHKEK